jgi:carboxyl-terminal processing protease
MGLAQAPSPDPAAQISRQERLKVFDKAWEAIDRHFYDPKFNGIDWPGMRMKYRPAAEAAEDKIQLQIVIDRMLRELGTSHTALRGAWSLGMGFGSIQVGDQWLVRWVSPDSPVTRAGVRRGWLIQGITGECTRLGNKVSLQFLDLRGQKQSLETTCGRYPGAVDTRNAITPTLPAGAVYFRLADFTDGADKALAKYVRTHRSAPAFVLDLRENWGGSGDTLVRCLDLFLREKTVVGHIRNRRGKTTTYRAGGKNDPYEGRLFILIDQRSGSSAEVFANVMQETGRATIVGRRSQGGVLGGEFFNLTNGFSIHVPVWDITTAKGVRLEGRGVTPDEAVTLTIADFREDHDGDLDRVRGLLSAKP